MAKAIMTYSIDPEIANAAQMRFPRQVSGMIEDYLRQLLNANLEVEQFNSQHDILEALSKESIEINKHKANVQVLQSQLKEIKEAAQQKIEQSLETSKDEYFNLPISKRQELVLELEKNKRAGTVKENMTPIEYYASLKGE